MFRKFIEYILVFLLIATSGFYYFYSNVEYVIIGAALVILFFFIYNKWIILDKLAIFIILAFVFWEILQFVILGGFEFRPILGTASRFFFAYGVIKLTEKRFIPEYVNIIFAFAIISLFFYSLFFIHGITEYFIKFSDQISPIFEIKDDNYRLDPRPNIVIFNFHGFELTPKRNSGPFWEPGAFSIFLNIALFFHLLKKKRLLTFKSIILIATIITTYSTSGILTLFVILTWYLYQVKTNLLIRIISLLAATILFVNVYFEVDFLGRKVQDNIEEATTTTGSRFGSALADWLLFKQNPIIGYGRNIDAKYGVSYFDLSIMHRNNGLTNLFVQWGLILALVYLVLYYKSLINITSFYKKDIKYTALTGFIVIILSGFSQGIFQYSLFHSLIFLGLIVYKFPNLKSPNNKIKPASSGQVITPSYDYYRNP